MQRSHLHYVVDVNIKGFFDNVNHGKLLKQMWTMGIRDKKLISIISIMLKAEVAGVGFPKKGTPQGGIISPLLSNIVLNELDWWLASQWEEMPTEYPYKGTVNPNGSVSRSHKFDALRRSKLKVVTSVRFADDFKIFTNSYSNAQKLYYATRDWLKERLSVDISPKKSKVINLKESYSEFLGFKIKLIPRGKNKDGSTRYVVISHIRDKSIAKMKPKLKKLIYEIEYPKSTGKEVYRAVSRYNAYVSGLHNYYRLATKICDDLSPFAISVHKSLKARLKERVKTAKQVRKYKIPCTTPLYIKEKYGKSMQLRYVEGHALIPIGYISHTPPKSMNRAINSYTSEGRTAIHKSLDRIDISVLHDIMRNSLLCESVEFNDNRLSLYSAQQGKCAISGEKLTLENIRCLRKVPQYKHGTDEYKNLILVTDTIAKLIDIRDTEKLEARVKTLKLTDKQYKKLTELRKLANC
jgi:group II intron reverse transcriptase maturase